MPLPAIAALLAIPIVGPIIVVFVAILAIAFLAWLFPGIGALFIGVIVGAAAVFFKDAEFIKSEKYNFTFGVFLGLISLGFIIMAYLQINPLSFGSAIMGSGMTSSIGGVGGLESTVSPASIGAILIVGALLFVGLTALPMLTKKKYGARK
jgi:hypothetical protein